MNTANTHLALQHLSRLTFVVVLVLGSGCASMRGKFKSGEMVDLMPFADQTIAMLTSSEYPLAQDRSVLIREFLTADTPGMARLDELLAEADRITESMLTYSVELVKISEMSVDEEDRIKALEAVVKTMEAPIRKKLALDDEAFKKHLNDITGQSDFLAAVREVQPLIESAGIYYGLVLSEAEAQATLATQAIDEKIDAKYQALFDFVKVLDARKETILKGLVLVHEHRAGDKEALKKLRDGKHILVTDALPPEQATTDDLARAETHLLERLQVMQTLFRSIEPEIDLYRRTHRELDEQYQFVRDGVAAARLKFVVWSQAHERMASGMKDDAEWFDISEAPALLIKAGVKAIK